VEVQKIFLFLIKVHETMIKNIPSLIEALKVKGAKISIDEESLLRELEERKNVEFNSMDSEFVYALSLIGSEFVQRFVGCWKKNEDLFFYQPTEWSIRFYYMHELGIDGKFIFDNMRAYITIDGLLSPNLDEHSGMLRFYVKYNRDSEITGNGIAYWLKRFKEFKAEEPRTEDAEEISYGLCALLEYDPELFKEEIAEHKEWLTSIINICIARNKEKFNSLNLRNMSYAIYALALLLEQNDPLMSKCMEHLIGSLKIWEYEKDNNVRNTLSPILLALIALGDGPKISKFIHDREIRGLSRAITQITPLFLQTAPNLNKRTLYSKISSMIQNAQTEVLIMTPFVDMLYESIVNRILDSQSLASVKIITRPKKDIGGSRSRIANSVLDILNTQTKGTLRVTELVHARMIITDSTQMIVSSADLTRDQLYDEYNAGLFTQDKEAIKLALDFFNNLYNSSRPLE
jgi:hypothetical protein